MPARVEPESNQTNTESYQQQPSNQHAISRLPGAGGGLLGAARRPTAADWLRAVEEATMERRPGGKRGGMCGGVGGGVDGWVDKVVAILSKG